MPMHNQCPHCGRGFGRHNLSCRMAPPVKAKFKVILKHVQDQRYDVYHDKLWVSCIWQAKDGRWFECPAGQDGEVKLLGARS